MSNKKTSEQSPDVDKPKVQRAVALHYKDSLELPKIVASGLGEIAKKIITLAEANGVPVHEDHTLTDLLARIPSGNAINSESFRLVAEIVAFLYHTDQEWKAKHKGLVPLLGN